MQEFLEAWRGQDEYQNILRGLAAGRPQAVIGMPVLPCALFSAALWQDCQRPLLLLTANEEEAQQLYQNLQAVLGERVLLFPVLELLPFEVYAHNLEVVSKRVRVLAALAAGEAIVVVAWVGAILRRLPPPAIFQGHRVLLQPGGCHDLSALARALTDMGYERVKLVDIPGTFSMRGSLVDIFPIEGERPVRIEFFDDEIDTMRYFSPADQLSQEACPALAIIPAQELPLTEQSRQCALEALEAELAKTAATLRGAPKHNLLERYQPFVENLRQGQWDYGMEQLACLLYPEPYTLLDYIDGGTLILSEPEAVHFTVDELADSRRSRYSDMLEAGQLLPSFYANFLDVADFEAALAKRPLLCFSRLPLPEDSPLRQIPFYCRVLPPYYHNPKNLREDCDHFRTQGYRVYFAAGSELRRKRMEEIIAELEFPGVRLVDASFSQGFESPQLKLAIITEEELLQKEQKQSRRRHRAEGQKIEHFMDLEVGDYVVHISQGIGRYLGVQRLTIGDSRRDYLLIQYAGNDKLYLPVDQLDLIQKYIGDDAQKPKLYRLGGGEWQRVKAKVRRGVEDMAKELLALYAAREAAQGFACGPDTNFQREFEDDFIYPETPDQLQAIAEIKHDMESTKPMDRLLCGDVGYGKTEVALRAAFKAISNGKQVAVLVPTTVLAQQHGRTFQERFAKYPVTIATLSRFNSAAEQKKTVEALKAGKVDIVIGTHRLLSKDVGYKDLGLLIIDEEQRFGVAHKEKIKELKAGVDVLVLSATPIPRTLHMALVGMRDMSVIATPPEDRHPVQTYVLEYHERLIRDVIMREISRGGQVYFVHNRVFNIHQVADYLEKLVPQAKVAVAHGQMKEKELEQVMMAFVENQANVLVCTTIIESGLDIPNVNTLIVNDADHFGLAQLYQLRGRVGRSERQAFAYFTYRREKTMNEIAKKRLIAIRDFTELGAGFKIAMRDMEIRGAGNILGPEQHGHIAAVGFDLYCRLLQEEIERQSGQAETPVDTNTLLELDIDAFLPDNYIDDANLKVEIYRRIAAVKESGEIDVLAGELRDRYGKLPRPVENLLLLGKIKSYSRHLGIASIADRGKALELKLIAEHPLSGELLVVLAEQWAGKINFQNKKDFIIRIYVDSVSKKEKIDILLEFLSQAGDLLQKEKERTLQK